MHLDDLRVTKELQIHGRLVCTLRVFRVGGALTPQRMDTKHIEARVRHRIITGFGESQFTGDQILRFQVLVCKETVSQSDGVANGLKLRRERKPARGPG
jgi:hypothetical protein